MNDKKPTTLKEAQEVWLNEDCKVQKDPCTLCPSCIKLLDKSLKQSALNRIKELKPLQQHTRFISEQVPFKSDPTETWTKTTCKFCLEIQYDSLTTLKCGVSFERW